MKNKLLIIGAGGHGKVIADIAIKIHKWERIFFLDDKLIGNSMDIEIIDKLDEALKYTKDYDIVVAIGNNFLRKEIQENIESNGGTIATLVHPNAIIGEQVEIGNGSVIMAGTVINCCSKIGKGCIINTGSTIDHDNVIEDYVHISPGSHLAGTVRIRENSWIGIGSTVTNNVTITSNVIIGAGSVVVKDIIEAGTYVGSPAKKIK